MIRVAILGASGYTALELCRILLRHPQVRITALTTRQKESRPLAAVHPALAGRIDLPVEKLTPAEVADRADCVFSCLPHGASAEQVAPLLQWCTRVIDFSADYRLDDPLIYAEWYGDRHPDSDRMKGTVYGLPERYRDRIAGADLVANPGCYPTSAILALAPLLQAGAISAEGIVIDSKSGVSGAGRQPQPHLHFPECNENFAAYGVGRHRHTPEIDQYLGEAAGRDLQVVFTPHLVPMDRGILSTCYAVPSASTSTRELEALLNESYAGEPFVRVVDQLPSTKQVSGTNACHLAVRLVRGRVVVISVVDNLIKGAAGAAVQNFNLMHELEETTALAG